MADPKIFKPHQTAAAQYLQKRFTGALLMQMRCGKNLVIIRHLRDLLSESKKALVVTNFGIPMNDWCSELKDEGQSYVQLRGNKKRKQKLLSESKDNWVVVNYESVMVLELHKFNWKAIILDETIKIANPRARLTKYFLKNFKHVNLRYILNGEPIPEDVSQMCCQFLFIHNKYMGCSNYWQYRSKYYLEHPSGFGWKPIEGHETDAINYIHKHAFVMSRQEAGIGSSKKYIRYSVEPTEEQLSALKFLTKNYEFDGVEYKNDMSVKIGYSYLSSGFSPSEEHRVLTDNKLQKLIEVINELNESKVLVWCRFRCEQKAILDLLKKNNIEAVQINGGMNAKEREFARSMFDKDLNIKVAVLTIKSCAKGQKWHSSNASIYFSNEWSYDYRSQSEDRIIHMEKNEPVKIIDIVTKKTGDDEIVDALKDKSFNPKLLMSTLVKRLNDNNDNRPRRKRFRIRALEPQTV